MGYTTFAEVQCLLRRKADVNWVSTYHGYTALHWAAYHNRAAIVQLLLEHGANPDLKDEFGRTALEMAKSTEGSIHNSTDCMRLLEQAASPPARAPRVQNRAAIITTMSADDLGWELHNAAYDGDKAKAQELLRRNADVNYADYNGQTPLHRAARENRAAMIQLLLEHGADPDLKDEDGKTALEYAKEENSTDCVRLLEQAAAAAEEATAKAAQVVALDADIQRISGLKQAKKWFQEHGVIEFFDDAVKQLGLTGPGDIEFLERADLEAIGMPALKVRRVLGAAKKAKSG